MKKILTPFLQLFGIILLSGSCSKSHTLPQSYNTGFPNNLGTSWKYKIYDSVNNQTDIVDITVIGTTKLDNGQDAAIWKVASLLFGVDTNYVTSLQDGIRIYTNKLNTAYPSKRYIFPLSVGNSWTSQSSFDTSKVVTKSAIFSMAGIFNEGYKIVRDFRTYPGFNHTIEEEWLVPDIGMVSRYYYEVSTGSVQKEKWDLISYIIK
jgi:hypothetical protein